MKKFLVFALVLVSACVLFADTLPINDKQMKVTLSIGENSAAKWAINEFAEDSSFPVDTLWTGMGEYTVSNPATIKNSEILSVYPSVKTNNANRVVMKVSGGALKHTKGGSTIIKLTATGVKADTDTSVTWDSNGDELKTITWTELPEKLGDGYRIISHELQLDLEDKSYADALAGSYEATLTLDVSVE